MKTFVAIARNRHFGRTAQEMNMTQPAISSRLVALEGELGHRLVNRNERDFSLTPEGEKALQSFENILGELHKLDAGLSGLDTPVLAPLRVGAIDSVSSTWMPHFIDALHQRFAGLKIELTVDGTEPLLQGLSKGRFDIIFAIQPLIGEGFRSFHSCTLQMVWAGSPKLIEKERVYNVASLADMPIISFPKNSPPYQMIAPYFHDEQILASKLTSCNSLYAIINLLVDGFGIGAIPTVTIMREMQSELLCAVNVSKRFPPMPIIATYQSSTHQDLVRVAVEQANESATRFCEQVQSEMAWIG
ncbi:LysR family transcriptional regulator [Ochrobactrum sp. BTU2]|uniref:LysR family transcriptional regulator n=1 Tax=Ochrobactrum sp. BTU2 TaxID=2856166 RepID=UPI00211A4E87|nr:LysR family transcriptional regulator [Ochrobactrum sp. BTU2]